MRSLPAGALALLAFTWRAGAQELDPMGAREEWLLAQPRLTLAPVGPETLPPGQCRLRIRADWGNDFGWSQTAAGESPRERRYLVDGEHAALDLEWRRGLTPTTDLALRVPWRWRGAGAMDGVIDFWHGFTRRLGLPDNDRELFLRDRFRVDARDANGQALAWGDAGGGLGNLELRFRRRFREAGKGSRTALVATAMLPTGSGPFSTGSVGAGLQLVGGRRLGARWDAAAGIGGAFETRDTIDEIRYARGRAHAFAAAEFRASRRVALLAETAAASRLATNLARYPGLQWYLNLGARLRLDSGWAIEASFSENLGHQQATTDFAVQLGLVRRFPR